MTYERALIIGAGAGLSASLARRFASRGMSVVLAARSTGDLTPLADETGAATHRCDAAQAADIRRLFEIVDMRGAPDVVVYNPSARVSGPITEIDGAAVEAAVAVTALGAFHAAQEAARRMVPVGKGAILLTGATAGVKGFAGSAAFAMGKFALRGLAQSLARELHPKGVHVGHFVIDGGIGNPNRPDREGPADTPDSRLDPDAIASEYLNLLDQHPSCWSWEVELRPALERF
ncbi:SDR family NAD(P)-dependent oxidoreductase [Pikeienuella piscinae]|uniref:SDR family NAD(P)-dependent oxidoreductase n=1 Tax=Pikeienuella piscinae TaxID=2748098 RepID=A0A7L5BY32_9RHOB|nr:SDR family NAD(P)-dependent oxidoreductase [Pikeienuella piscinae]QIE55427.1 SDR family NAD(P)-dependent oxidoreductase [Pikeienuella piscinae]